MSTCAGEMRSHGDVVVVVGSPLRRDVSTRARIRPWELRDERMSSTILYAPQE